MQRLTDVNGDKWRLNRQLCSCDLMMDYVFEEEEKPEMDFVNACTVALLSQIYGVYA